jgi:cytoskeletal protein CcmA (bactofilin family)
MGYPDKPTPKLDADFQSRLTTSFGRLKAATGLARSSQSEPPVAPAPAPVPAPPPMPAPPVVSAQDTIDAPPLSHAGPSILSEKVELNGTLNAPTALHIYGAVKGDVRAGDLSVFPGGSIKGDVVAESVVVHGSIEGDIQAKKVQLCSGALVRGDIVHSSLGVDVAATFEGISKRSDNPAADMKSAAAKRNGSSAAAAPGAGRYSSPS